MSEIKDYLVENYKDTNFYTSKLWRSGLSDFAHDCHLRDNRGQCRKEANPNLPEGIEEQVQQTYDATRPGQRRAPPPEKS